LFNLSDFLPKKPGDVEIKVMQEMFEASVDGEAYDADRWSNYFRPSGMAARTGDPNTASSNGTATSMTSPATPQAPVAESAPAAPAPTPAPEAAPAPAAEAAAPAGDGADILAMIRARQNQ
jgi:pyruvate/2-oxoglutarate dehydrogenase complex dihydrolipoamide acyltransferase (E2) component